MAISTLLLEKYKRATAVVISKVDNPLILLMTGFISSTRFIRSPFPISILSTLILSVNSCKCGEVYKPTLYFAISNTLAINEQIDPFPLVPAT